VSHQPRHVVVIGHGMVGARFVDEVARRDPRGERLRLTVVGAEAEGPYNRVLLPEVLSGRLGEADLALPEPALPGLDVRRGTSAAAVDTAARTVALDDGDTLHYDELVLATGARAAVPPLPGATTSRSRPAEGVTVLRDLADCRRLAALTRPGAPVVVLGGGVLGLETARALGRRGARVHLVEAAAWLMHRQLDQGAARVLAGHYTRLGVTVHSRTAALRWIPGRGLELEDGRVLAGDVLVVATGVRPRTELAAAAGLHVDRGIVVDDSLTTSDPRVHAIGDCAQHAGGGAGLVQPGYEQAAVLADLLTGTAPQARYTGSRPATRLKADGVELVSFGAPDVEDAETVTVDDSHGGRYAKLSVREGRVAGAILLGFPDAAATIGQLYDRGLPVPEDRLALLLGGALPATAGDGADPEEALVCRCNAVSRAQVESAWLDGARTREDIAAATRATTGCGGCVRDVNALLASWNGGRPAPVGA